MASFLRTRLPALLLAVLCLFLPAGAPPVASPPHVASVRPLRELDGAWARFAGAARPTSHWTGGDSTYSVPVPGGELWVFSDTFLGRVRPDGSRAPLTGKGATPFVHNSFVRWDAAGPHTVTGRDRAGRPASLVPGAADGSSWYWARAAIRDGRDVTVVYARYVRTGTGPLDVAWRANTLARFRPGDLTRPSSLTPLPSAAGVAWGAWLARDGDHTYVYGTEPAPGGAHYLRLARTDGTDLRHPWRYRTADGGWSARETDAARLTGPDGAALLVSDELSVVRHGHWYALVTQRADQPFSAELRLAWSRTPAGPFTRPRTFHTAPEAGPRGTYRNANVIAYNPHEHPELERRGELVVSYNVNSLVPEDVIRTASVYRPRFLRVTLVPPGR
ncbi:hypothetical protein [Streptomyces huiliensis]|uniref:hypothetical protein n=1 Tax=Streptomyces huiliensis TaxID=2876027 RepID=UPI001CBD13CA|nr:hypothetical protein [Streptomyces huiliensis]MBZ4319965.1 hypothetical protein [Streptomyces huiliensis]